MIFNCHETTCLKEKNFFFLEENIFQQRYLSSGCLGQFYDDRTSSMIEGHGNRNGFLVGVVREQRERNLNHANYCFFSILPSRNWIMRRKKEKNLTISCLGLMGNCCGAKNHGKKSLKLGRDFAPA